MSARCRDVTPGVGRCQRLVRGSKNFYCDDHQRWTESALLADLIAARARLACGMTYPLQVDRREAHVLLELDPDTLAPRARGAGGECESVVAFLALMSEFDAGVEGRALDELEDLPESSLERDRIRSELTTRCTSTLRLEGGRVVPLRIHAQTRALQFRVERCTTLHGLRAPMWCDAPGIVTNWLLLDTWATLPPAHTQHRHLTDELDRQLFEQSPKIKTYTNIENNASKREGESSPFFARSSTPVDAYAPAVAPTAASPTAPPADPAPRRRNGDAGGEKRVRAARAKSETEDVDARPHEYASSSDAPPPPYAPPPRARPAEESVEPPLGHTDLKNPYIAAVALERGAVPAVQQSVRASRLDAFRARTDLGALGDSLRQFGFGS